MDFHTGLGLVGLFGTSLVFSYAAIWLLLLTPAVRLFIDRPGVRKLHQRVIPRVGGVCIVFSMLLFVVPWHYLLGSSLFPLLPQPILYAVVWICTSILLVGIPDDTYCFTMRNSHKFLLEIAIAVVVVFFIGVRFDTVHVFGWSVYLGWLGGLLSVVWIVGVANAVNIIDGADCLSGSVVVTSLAAIAVVAAVGKEPGIVVFCVLGCGLVGGFLLHNGSPARVFLGDTGSLFLGMVLGVLSMYLVSRTGPHYPVVVAPLMVGFPILDVFLAMVRRFLKAYSNGASPMLSLRAMTVADNEHIHHRLIFRGLNHLQTSLVLTVFAGSICAAALIATFSSRFAAWLVLAYLGLVIAWLVARLDFFERPAFFFDRYLRARRPPKPLPEIAVVNTDEVLRHALETFPQELLRFHFVRHGDIYFQRRFYAAVLINNLSTDKLDEDIALSLTIGKDSYCPILITADVFNSTPEQLRAYTRAAAHFMKKPVYVPHLIERLYRLVGDCATHGAFDLAFRARQEITFTDGGAGDSVHS